MSGRPSPDSRRSSRTSSPRRSTTPRTTSSRCGWRVSDLLVEYNDGDDDATLDPAYALGTPYDLEIAAADGHIRVSYNGTQKADIVKSGAGWYFKAGSYVQSNLSRGDAPNAEGQVVIYALHVQHAA